MSSNNKTAAVVIGLDINGLGVARWLSHEGVKVYALDKTFDKATGKTNAAQKVKIRAVEGDALIEELVEFRRKFDDNPVLFVTMEKSLRTISKHRAKLENLYRFTMPDHETLMALMNKNGVLEMAERAGIRYPRTLNVNAPGLIDGAREFNFPCIFKPSEQNTQYGDEIKKAYKTQSLDEIKTIYEEIRDRVPNMVIQEWIEGTDSDIYFLLEYIDTNGEVIADFPGRKIRSWPPNVGGTASCTSAYDMLDQLRDATGKYFKAAKFTGMGGMEFKRDSRTGELMMIEPTVARTDLQHEVAMVHGVNLVYAQYCAETGQEFPTPTPSKERILWCVEPINRYSRETFNTPEQEKLEKSMKKVDAIARISDPLPFIYDFCAKVSAKLRQILNR